MSWGSDHSHRGEYAEERHDHREIDEVRWDMERRMDDRDSELDRRITWTIDENNTAREELWAEIETLRTQLTTLAAKVGEVCDQLQNARA